MRYLKRRAGQKRPGLTTVHGVIGNSVLSANVGTVAAIKGGISSPEPHDLKTQVNYAHVSSACASGR